MTKQHRCSSCFRISEKIDCKGCILSPFFETPEKAEAAKVLIGYYGIDRFRKKIERKLQIYGPLGPIVVSAWAAYKSNEIETTPNYLVTDLCSKFERMSHLLRLHAAKFSQEELKRLQTALESLKQTIDNLEKSKGFVSDTEADNADV